MTRQVVTQAHRERAVLAIYDAYTTPGTSLNDWCLTGKPGHMTGTYRRLDAVAQAIADAEQKGRELELTSIVAWLRLGEPGPSSRTYALCIERRVHAKSTI